jgi:hypothetical protein
MLPAIGRLKEELHMIRLFIGITGQFDEGLHSLVSTV